jgi:hypothetical protein
VTDSVDILSGGINQSFKSGQQYKERITRFSGSVERVVEDVVKFFRLDPAQVAGLSPHEVMVLADQIAQANLTVARELGGTPVAESESASNDSATDPWAAAESGQASAPAEAEKPAVPVDPKVAIFAGIEASTSRAELQRLWAENQELFNANTDLMDAYKAKGKGLPA